MKEVILEKIKNVEFFKELLNVQSNSDIHNLFSKENIEITNEDLQELKNTIEEGYNVVTEIPEEQLENFTGGIDVKELNSELTNFPILGLLSTPISNLGQNRINASHGIKKGDGIKNVGNMLNRAFNGPTETDNLNKQLGDFLKDHNGILSAGVVTVAIMFIIIGAVKVSGGIKSLINKKK